MSPALLVTFLRGFVAELVYMAVCPWCARRYPHHTNSSYSIAGGDRHPVYDLHNVEDSSGVGLRECWAYDLRIRITGQR